MNIKVFLDMLPCVWCTVKDVSEKLAAKDSRTEAGGNKLLHILCQSMWFSCLKRPEFSSLPLCKSQKYSCAIFIVLRINS